MKNQVNSTNIIYLFILNLLYSIISKNAEGSLAWPPGRSYLIFLFLLATCSRRSTLISETFDTTSREFRSDETSIESHNCSPALFQTWLEFIPEINLRIRDINPHPLFHLSSTVILELPREFIKVPRYLAASFLWRRPLWRCNFGHMASHLSGLPTWI